MAPIPVLEQVRMRGATLCARSMRRTPPAALLRRRKSLARASSADDDAARAKAEFEEKMKDPAVLESMKTMMSSPQVQEQMQSLQEMQSSPEFKLKMEKLQADPELKEMFDEMKTGGMGALMKFWNDTEKLKLLSKKLGGAAGGPSPPMTAGDPPAAKDLLEAAKLGDIEAAEDYIAIGKDVNEGDSESRRALHFASGAGHVELCELLLEEGAAVDAKDSKMNTPCHYAAGYGRVDVISLLIDRGAAVGLQNGSGKRAIDLAGLNPDNPILQNEDLVARLTPSSPFVDG